MSGLKLCLVSAVSPGKGKVISTGIRILAGIAHERDKSCEIQVYDGNFHSDEELITRIRSFNPDILGMSVFTDNSEASKQVLNSITCPIKIAGGPFASNLPNKTLEYCDFVFLGESESIFSEFLDQIERAGFNKDKVPYIRGLMSKALNIDSTPAELADLKKVPLSGWSYVKNYLGMLEEASPMWHLKPNLINLLSARGCTNNCVFCLSSKLHGNHPRFREVKDVEEEIKLINKLREQQGLSKLESVMLDDSDLFLRDKDSLKDLFQMFGKLRVTYSAFASVNNPDITLLELGKETGLKSLFFGIETSQRNRKRISPKKYFDDAKAREVIESCRERGIFTCTSFIIGFPWEDKADIRETIECMDNLPSDYPGIGVLDMHPGTAVWRYRERHPARNIGNDSPNSQITKAELEESVKAAYNRAYTNPIRLRRFASIKDQFDHEKAMQVVDRKRRIYE